MDDPQTLAEINRANIVSAFALENVKHSPQGVSTPVTLKKTKGKKKKLSAKMLQLKKLDGLSEKLHENHDKFNEFISFVIYWLDNKELTCLNLFEKQINVTNKILRSKSVSQLENNEQHNIQVDDNAYNDDIEYRQSALSMISIPKEYQISYDDFQTVLLDMKIPCSRVEMHLLCKLLDPRSTQIIDIRTFRVDVLRSFIKHKQRDGIRMIKSAQVMPTKHRPIRNKQPVFVYELWEPLSEEEFPKYVLLDLKLLTFANDREFSGHIKEEFIYSHITVFSLVQLIKKKKEIASTRIALFRDTSRTKTSMLEDNKTLEESGFKGGSFDNPKEYTIYYDYLTTFRFDPLMSSDFYFIDRPPMNHKK